MKLITNPILFFILTLTLLSCTKDEYIIPCPEYLTVDCHGLTEKECSEYVRKIQKKICEEGGLKSRAYTEEEMLCLGTPRDLFHKDNKNVTKKSEDFLECDSYINDKGHPKDKKKWYEYLIRKMKDESEVQFTQEEILKFRDGELEDFRWGERYFKATIKGYLQKHNIPYQDNEYSKKIEPIGWPPADKEEEWEKHTPPNLRKRILEQEKSRI